MRDSSGKLESKVVKNGLIGGFTLNENVYPAEYHTPVHHHDYSYFCLVLKGDYTLNYNGRGYLCQASKVLFFPAGAEHSCHVHSDSRCLNIQLGSEILRYTRSHTDLPADHLVQKRQELVRLTERLYSEFHDQDEFSPLTVEGLVFEITAEFFRYSLGPSAKDVPQWLRTARDFLCDKYADTVRISTVAEVAGVHPTHLAREFRRRFQLTIGDFVRQRRIEFACTNLTSSGAPLSEIALESGFFDQSHFTRVFKKATGMTPDTYRKAFGTR